MESLAHSRQHSSRGSSAKLASKKTFNNSNSSNNGASFSSKTIYDDVYGGPPKYAASSAALSPRFEDYSEIFGSFHVSRASSIPYLDLPPVDETEIFFDVRSSGFDYSEVFGASDGLDFAVSYDELVDQSRPREQEEDDSSQEAWTPARTESLSGDSDHSGKNLRFSNGDSDPPFDASPEFNISYNAANIRGINGDLTNGMTAHASGITCLGHELSPDENPSSFQVCDDSYLSMDFSMKKEIKGKHFNNGDGPAFRNAPNEMFVTISEINLRTEPCHVPPPSRPPPRKDVGTSGLSSNIEVSSGDSSPTFFDVEVDSSSSAAASAAAIKEAMEKAKAKMQSARERMEKKKEGGVHNRVKPVPKIDATEDGKVEVIKTTDNKPSAFEKVDCANEWKEEMGFFELVRTDKPRKVASGQANEERVLVSNDRGEREREKTVMEAFMEQIEENDKKVKANRKAHGRKEKDTLKSKKPAEEDKKKTGLAQPFSESKTEINGATKVGKDENLVGFKQRENICESDQAMPRRENEGKKKEAGKRNESYSIIEESRRREDNAKEQKDAAQHEENKKVVEEEENEKRLTEAALNEQAEENKKRVEEEVIRLKKEVLDQEENERRIKVALEKEENLKRQEEEEESDGEYERELEEALAREIFKQREREARKLLCVQDGYRKRSRFQHVDACETIFEESFELGDIDNNISKDNSECEEEETEKMLRDEFDEREAFKGASHQVNDENMITMEVNTQDGLTKENGLMVKPESPFSESQPENPKVDEKPEDAKRVEMEEIKHDHNKEMKFTRERPVNQGGNERAEKEKNLNEILESRRKENERLKNEEKELENEQLRKLEEEREREREREKDRMVANEAQQRAMNEARERLERACVEAREKSLAGRAAMEAKIRADRAAVERANAEARERMERSISEKFSASSSSRNNGMRQSSSSSSDLSNLKSQSLGPTSVGFRYTYSSSFSERTEGVEGETAQRCKARLERYQRTAERAAKALAEKNMRDLLAQREQAERHRLAETLDADVRRWSSGKEGNLRALLSTLQYILGPDVGWQPIPLTEVITSAAVKKAYRKATLCVHPDKLQQRGANIQQKYVCEKVFDLLKEAWNRFNSEER